MSEAKAMIACKRYAAAALALKQNHQSISNQMLNCERLTDEEYYSCVSRNLTRLKKERTNAVTSDDYSDIETLEDCDLCDECCKVLPMLDERKELRKQRGIALRAVGAIGRSAAD